MKETTQHKAWKHVTSTSGASHRPSNPERTLPRPACSNEKKTSLEGGFHAPYWWWKNPCTSWYVKYPIILQGFIHLRWCRISSINTIDLPVQMNQCNFFTLLKWVWMDSFIILESCGLKNRNRWLHLKRKFTPHCCWKFSDLFQLLFAG